MNQVKVQNVSFESSWFVLFDFTQRNLPDLFGLGCRDAQLHESAAENRSATSSFCVVRFEIINSGPLKNPYFEDDSRSIARE